MEYIQCPHCLHKYGVNERMRTAVGKKICCKQCQQAFRIIILGTPDKSADSVKAESHKQERSLENKQGELRGESKNRSAGLTAGEEQDSVPSSPDEETHGSPRVKLKKKLNTQFITFLALIFTLLCTGVGLIIYFEFPQWLAAIKPGPTDTITSSKSLIKPIKPITLFPAGPPEADNAAKELPPVDDTAGRDKTMLQGPDHPSQACRDVAANFWIRIHVMSTVNLDTRTYMKLLDQGLHQPDEIRKLCRDRFLAGRLTDAAKQDKTPEWISKEIEQRTQTR